MNGRAHSFPRDALVAIATATIETVFDFHTAPPFCLSVVPDFRIRREHAPTSGFPTDLDIIPDARRGGRRGVRRDRDQPSRQTIEKAPVARHVRRGIMTQAGTASCLNSPACTGPPCRSAKDAPAACSPAGHEKAAARWCSAPRCRRASLELAVADELLADGLSRFFMFGEQPFVGRVTRPDTCQRSWPAGTGSSPA